MLERQATMRSTSSNNMTTGSPWKLILRFSLPLLVGNLLQQAYNIVDSIVVGKFVGTTALAAVGTSFPVIFLLLSLFIGLGIGSTIIISQYYGADNRESVKKTIDTTYITMFAIGVPLSIVGIFLSEPLLLLMNTPADVLPQATAYMQIIFAGTIASFGYNINSSILQGLGDSRSPLLYLLIATVTNIGLDLLFVAVFDWGVAGVAWATIIAQVVAFVFGIWHIHPDTDLHSHIIAQLAAEQAAAAGQHPAWTACRTAEHVFLDRHHGHAKTDQQLRLGLYGRL